MRRRRALGGLVGLALSSHASASAAASEHELVPPRVCLAGDWGKPHDEWRVQLGVFADEAKAEAFIERLAKAGIAADAYIAVWLVRGDDEPLAVVTRAVFADEKKARAAARKLRRGSLQAFARYYTRYA